MSTSLMELTDEYQTLLSYAEGADPEDEQMFLDTLGEVKAQIAVKTDGYVAVMKDLDSRADLFEREAARLNNAAKAMKNRKKAMLETAKAAMEGMGKTELQGRYHKLKIVKNGGIAPLEITGEVPDSYKKVILDNDKEKIRKALEGGEKLSFARIGEKGTHIKVD